MPKALEMKLESEASSKGFTGKKKDAYVYGTLRKTGWTPSTQKKPKVRSRNGIARQGMFKTK